MTSEPVRDDAGRAEDPIRCGSARRLVVAVGLLFAMVAAASNGQEEGFDAKRLGQLIAAGDYRAAIAEAASLEEAARPKAKDPAFVPKVRAAVEMLVTKARLERRIGDLDAAEETLAAAFKAYTDREFQRRLGLAVRAAGDQAAPAVVPYKLLFVELHDEGMRLVVDRLVKDGATAAAERVGSLKAQIEQLANQATTGRQGLPEELAAADPALAASPRAIVLASDVPQLELAGLFGLATSRLPQAAAAKSARTEAVSKLARAADRAEELLGVGQETAAADDAARLAQAEADRIRADLLEGLAEAKLFAGDAAGAREAIERAIELRMRTVDEFHPDLIRPTILYAGIVEAQRRASEAAGKAFPAREQAKLVAKLCSSAEDLLTRSGKTFEPEWPWRASLAAVAKNVVVADGAGARDPETADAVDAATRRVMPLVRDLP